MFKPGDKVRRIKKWCSGYFTGHEIVSGYFTGHEIVEVEWCGGSEIRFTRQSFDRYPNLKHERTGGWDDFKFERAGKKLVVRG